MNIDKTYRVLAERINPTKLIKNASMKEHTSFRAGGPVALLVIPGSVEELKFILRTLVAEETDYFIMGNGTNLLVRDEGYNGVIVKIGSDLSRVTVTGEKITAEAGALLSVVSGKALEYSLTGFEFASGIPGSLGGAVFMNAGAYGGEMRQVVERVRVLSRDGKREYGLNAEEMQYGYRKSILMESGDIVLSADIKLTYGQREVIASKMKELASRRNEKQPLKYPSAGSFFKRPVGNFAGKLIQDANLKGKAIGDARVSPLHAGFIINEGNATATDIINLMELVQNTVYRQFSVLLEPEVRIIGDNHCKK